MQRTDDPYAKRECARNAVRRRYQILHWIHVQVRAEWGRIGSWSHYGLKAINCILEMR